LWRGTRSDHGCQIFSFCTTYQNNGKNYQITIK
jgi:hypothetical protein